MPIYRTQCTIATVDNLPANYATNTWHVSAPDLVELALWHTQLATFYGSLNAYFSNLVRTTDGFMCKSYDLEDPEPRQPVLTFEANLAPTGGNALPPEVALCMSFQAAPVSGIPQARRRNRIFFPFPAQSANATTGRPSAAFTDALRDAGAVVLANSGPTSADWEWVVYSPTDDTVDFVDNGWVDNEWDIQRRRGRLSTARDVF